MPIDLLQTKLYIPRLRSSFVPRQRLVEMLNQGLHCKLTLLSAPAGFGKTTLVSEWVASLGLDAPREEKTIYRIAWLSLDKDDNDLARFLTYLVTALSQVEGTATSIGEAALDLLQSAQPPLVESILTYLVNDITAVTDGIVLVLDDYHVIESQSVDDALRFLLEHLPPQMHLVITTRSDPNIPLARYRAQGQLAELRDTNLRFTVSETAGFLNEVMGLNLSEEDITALKTRTEGWAAGLQLAAFSIRGHQDDKSDFVRGFTGSNRFIVDYLLEEVLLAQPESVQQFLLQTSILNHLTGPLCDALLQCDSSPSSGQSMLESLEMQNLFIIPLDDQRRWYRYHRLFADLLLHRLKVQSDSATLVNLHKRAGRWYGDNGFVDEAIEHMLAASDFEQAARLIERARHSTLSTLGEMSTYLRWLQALPEALIHERPKLALVYGWALLPSGQYDQIEGYLRAAEEKLQSTSLTPMNADLIGEIAGLRSQIARLQGNISGCIMFAEQALANVAKDNLFVRCSVNENLGIAHLINGELPAATLAYEMAIEQGQAVGNSYMTLCAYRALGRVQHQEGQLHQAAATYRRGLDFAAGITSNHGNLLPVAGDLFIGLSEIQWQWNELEEAEQNACEGIELSKSGEHVCAEVLGYLSLASIRQAQHNHKGALKAFQSIEDLANERQSVERTGIFDWIRPYKVLLWLDQGNLEAATEWAEHWDLHVDKDLEQPRFEHYVLARVYLAQNRLSDALALLDRLLSSAKITGRVDHIIRILTLQSMALANKDQASSAVKVLQEALRLGQAEGYIRTFANEGQPMRQLLAASLAQGAEPAYTTRLMQVIDPAPDTAAAPPDPNQLLIEPLSDRELEVLALLANGLTNQAIADELVIALSTVKKHVNNILGKLHVGNRTQAVSRAQELNIL